MAQLYARRQLVRGADGLLNVVYVDINTGQQIDRGSISDYKIVDANAGSYWGDKGGKGKKDDEEEDDKKKKKKKKTPFDDVGDRPTSGIVSPGSETSKYTSYINATPTTKFSTTTTNSKQATTPSEDEEQGDVTADVTASNDGLVRSISQEPGSMDTGPVSSVPSYESKISNSFVSTPTETAGFTNGKFQSIDTRTLGLASTGIAPGTYSRQNWTDEDRQAVAQTLAGEIDQRKTDLSTEEGQREAYGILTSIENRAIARGMTPAEIAKQSNSAGVHQYSAWNKAAIGTTLANYENNPDMFNGIVSGYLSDPDSRLGNFTNYHANYVNPSWSSAMQDVQVIGQHKFGYLPEFDLPADINVMGTTQTLPGVINGNVQSTIGLTSNPSVPTQSVQSVPGDYNQFSTDVGMTNPSVNPLSDYYGGTTQELGFKPGINTQYETSVPTNQAGVPDYSNQTYDDGGFHNSLPYDPSATGSNLPGMASSVRDLNTLTDRDLSGTPGIHSGGAGASKFSGPTDLTDRGFHYSTPTPNYDDGGFHNTTPKGFGDNFNPENLNYDPSYESQTLSDSQDVDRINGMVNSGYNVVSPMAPVQSLDALNQPQVGFDSPSYSNTVGGRSGAGDGFGSAYSPQGFGADPSGTNGMGGFGSGMGGDVGGPGGPNTVGGYFDGGFHSTTPSYTPDAPTYDDGGFHRTTPTNTPSAPAVGFTSPTTPASTFDTGRFSFDESRFSTPTYDDGGFHRGTPGSTSESPSGGSSSGGGSGGGW